MNKSVKYLLLVFFIIMITIGIVLYFLFYKSMNNKQSFPEVANKTALIELPEPKFAGSVSIEEALLKRRSVREYQEEPLTLFEISQILWSAQGITNQAGHRTAPSAGALYPLELYIVVGDVKKLPAGVYKYRPDKHALKNISSGDKRESLKTAALGQPMVADAPVTLVFTAVYERTTAKYGERGKQYVWIEVGHAAQNVYLQAESFRLGAVVIGAFHEDQMKEICNIEENEEPIYLMSVGKKVNFY